VYRNLRYILDRGHPLQLACEGRPPIFGFRTCLGVALEHEFRRRGGGNVVILQDFQGVWEGWRAALYGFPSQRCIIEET
jgi:hypothetical protein